MTLEKFVINGCGGGQEGDRKGKEIENKVTQLLLSQEIISYVNPTPKWTQMVDLIVGLDPNRGFSIADVNVQVKASTKGSEHFKEGLKRRLLQSLHEGEQQMDRTTYLLENKLILIVGEEKRSKTGKTSRLVSDEEIIQDFNEQLLEIDNYWKNK